jgi:N-acetylglucosamine-6-phosphate deacetylase
MHNERESRNIGPSSHDLKDKLIKFVNCKIVKNHQLIDDYLWVRNGTIVNYAPIFWNEKKREDIIINCDGGIIAPGFIDVQINGGFGYDFSDQTQIKEGLLEVSHGILAHGVTSFVPTVITSSSVTYSKVLPLIKEAMTHPDKTGAHILGCHLEGPFISHGKKGAHPPSLIRCKHPLSLEEIEEVYGQKNLNKDIVSIMTIAPELDPNMSVIHELTKRGIVVSIGHSEASFEIGEKAVKAGASFITHLFNGMLGFHHRGPGLPGLLTSTAVEKERRTIFYGNVVDGLHTHPNALKIAYRSHPKGCILVTDAMAALGLPEGKVFKIGESDVEIRNHGAYVAGTETLAGAIASMDMCVRNLRKFTGCSIVEAVECATLHPAMLLGIDKKKGSLNFGCDADLVILNKEDLTVKETYLLGVKVWESK